jgi:hypothetical protein
MIFEDVEYKIVIEIFFASLLSGNLILHLQHFIRPHIPKSMPPLRGLPFNIRRFYNHFIPTGFSHLKNVMLSGAKHLYHRGKRLFGRNNRSLRVTQHF